MARGVALGVALGLVVSFTTLAFVDRNKPAYGQQTAAAREHRVQVVQVPASQGGQYVVVVDTDRSVMGSYHVSPETGNIALRSVRNFLWDLQMDEFNGSEPRPHEVRALVEQR